MLLSDEEPLPGLDLRKKLRGLSLDVSNMMKRAALDAREEAKQRARDADEVSTMAKKLFFQYLVDAEDFVDEYGDPIDYSGPEQRGLYTKSIREILTSDT